MKRDDIVFVKARFVERQEGAAVVRVLNGFGEPEITVIEENMMSKKDARGALQALVAVAFAALMLGASACDLKSPGRAPEPAAAAAAVVPGNIVPRWDIGSNIVAELWPNGKGGFFVVIPRETAFVSADVIRAEMGKKAAEEAAAQAAAIEALKAKTTVTTAGAR